MARFQCKCGFNLSNSKAPNDIELVVYTDKEWDKIINLGDLIDPIAIPFLDMMFGGVHSVKEYMCLMIVR